MAPNRLEDTIREKLQERELQPRQDAWDKLSSQLDKQFPEKIKRSYLWYAVAASFIGVIMITTFLFRTNNEEKVPLVKNNPPEISNEKEFIEAPVKMENVKLANEQTVSTKSGENEIENSTLLSKKESNTMNTEDKTLAITSNEKKQSGLKEKPATAVRDDLDVDKGEKGFYEVKKETIAFEVKSEKSDTNIDELDEIDALLLQAQTAINNEEKSINPIQNIDPSELLLDVELELEQSFREKAFQVLGKGFNAIRTAVSERNN